MKLPVAKTSHDGFELWIMELTCWLPGGGLVPASVAETILSEML